MSAATQTRVDQKSIPVSAGKRIADEFGYDQIVIVGRRVGGHEHVTTYGRDTANCEVAARMGNFFKHKLMGWPDEGAPDLLAAAIRAKAWIEQEMEQKGWPRERIKAPPAGSHLEALNAAIAKATGAAS